MSGNEISQTDCLFSADTGFLDRIREMSGQPVELCFQCQKCSSGCPAAAFSDFAPNKLIRFIQFGCEDTVLRSPFIWQCTSCETCGARCPNGIRTSEVVDALKELAVKKGYVQGNTPVFHMLFLKDVYKRGRVFETGLMAGYKLKTKQYFTDLAIGLKMFQKGKMPLLPPAFRAKNEIREIFKKSKMDI